MDICGKQYSHITHLNKILDTGFICFYLKQILRIFQNPTIFLLLYKKWYSQNHFRNHLRGPSCRLIHDIWFWVNLIEKIRVQRYIVYSKLDKACFLHTPMISLWWRVCIYACCVACAFFLAPVTLPSAAWFLVVRPKNYFFSRFSVTSNLVVYVWSIKYR